MLRRTLFAHTAALALATFTAAAFAEDLPEADAVVFEDLDQVRALAAKGPTVIYFHAHWCPTCQATMTSFQARWPEVRPGLTLVIADYDKDLDIKSAYGVTYQNTFVQVNTDGSKLQIWNGGGLEALNERTQFPL